ncbi:MAG: protein-glutamate O-methyltransferase CheR, partial [Gammaproteobacteria bacterium]|nr:protein-glutamate O-methyltransferase CheR [Gammaproteobacteria bacterium]
MHLHTWEQPFLDFILASAGLKLHQHQMDSFYTLVYSACERFGYHHPLAYLNSLKSSPQWSPEMEYLISGTTVGETYFFRDLTQISFIRDHWLPRIIEQRRNSGERRLRVWSAGSATGEELYMMAIILRELLQDIDYWDIQLIGTDINNSSIVKATEGIYSQWSLRSIDEQIREKYFTTMGDGFVLNSSIRKMANFKHFNLNNDQLPFDIRGSHNIDLILCRNVFIYFSYPVIRHVMEKFSEALVLGGTLMLAPTDIPDVTQNYPGLEYAQHDGVFFYQRNDNQLVNTTLETANQPSFFAKFDTGVKVDKTVTFKPEKPVFSSPVASDLT